MKSTGTYKTVETTDAQEWSSLNRGGDVHLHNFDEFRCLKKKIKKGLQLCLKKEKKTKVFNCAAGLKLFHTLGALSPQGLEVGWRKSCNRRTKSEFQHVL